MCVDYGARGVHEGGRVVVGLLVGGAALDVVERASGGGADGGCELGDGCGEVFSFYGGSAAVACIHFGFVFTPSGSRSGSYTMKWSCSVCS